METVNDNSLDGLAEATPDVHGDQLHYSTSEDIPMSTADHKQMLGDGGDQAGFSLVSDISSPRSCHKDASEEMGEGLATDLTRKQRLELGSPEGKKYLRYHSPGKPNMRHQLLVQRTFSPHCDDRMEPRTSSPMRKVRLWADPLGAVSSSPTKATSHPTFIITEEPEALLSKVGPFVPPPVENAVPSHDVQTIFKTPIRAQHPGAETTEHTTPLRPTLSLMSSPASSGSGLFTPGRHFVNPFEMDHDRLHMPMFSPSVFNSGTPSSAQKKDTEGFWSLEHTAVLMPVEIKDSEVQKQLHYQRKIDREQNAKVQTAINRFFNNEVIVPSPWNEKVNHFLPRTPTSINSVSCQTTLSVPPGVDLLAELGAKYQLSDQKADSFPSVDSMGSSFIRRKLLNQLNENDSEILASPKAPIWLPEKSPSISPSPARRQSTPEWEDQTPNKHSSGHFSSSPIREEPDERGHHPALSESELLASPELSPVAGSRSIRSSGVYCSEQDMDNPRAIMQLDFSSILDEGSDDEEEGDRLGTLIQRTATENQSSCGLSNLAEPQVSALSQDSGGHADQQARHQLLTTALSSESALDTVSCSTSGPQLGSSQDTGYHTASMDTVFCSTSGPHLGSSQDTGYHTASLALSSSNLPFLEGAASGSSQELASKPGSVAHTDLTSEFTRLKHKSDLSGDGSFFLASAAVAKDAVPTSRRETSQSRRKESCIIRKIRTMSDVRLSREKRSVSRDLTQSFNMNCSSKSDELRRSLSENFYGTESNSVPDLCDPFNCSMQSVRSLDSNTSLTKHTPTLFPTPRPKPGCSELPATSENHGETEGGQAVSSCEGSFQSKFSLGDDSTLQQAWQLLGKSEQLRQRHSELEAQQSDNFQCMLLARDENIDPDEAMASLMSSPHGMAEPAGVLTPTSRMLESVERNINSVQSSKLGSEIAAEILKRAEDDLAQVTGILEENPVSPR